MAEYITLGDFIPCEFRLENSDALDEIRIVERRQKNGESLWAVKHLSECLNKDFQWEFEPMGSSRDDDFLKRCRFESIEEAIEAFTKNQMLSNDNSFTKD